MIYIQSLPLPFRLLNLEGVNSVNCDGWTYIIILEVDRSLLHGVSLPEVVCNMMSKQSRIRGVMKPTKLI